MNYDVIEGAGSHYGPTAILIDIDGVIALGEPFAFVGKPCDIAALRSYARHDSRVDNLVKYRLTPVCGGFMPPESMKQFLKRISPHFSPPCCCDGPLPRPVGILLGQGPRHRVHYACGPLCRHIF